MKIAKSAYSKDDSKGNRKVKPILPLVPEDDDLEYGDSTRVASFKLRTVPADANSAKYSFAIQIMDGTRSVRQAINWYNRTKKLFRGLGLTDVAAKDNLIKELVKDAPLAAYTAAVSSRRALAWAHAKDAAEVLAAGARASGESAADYRTRIEAVRNGVAEPDVNDDMIDHGLGSVIESVCPYKALEKQKRYMRRFMRKPADMLTRNYVNHIIRMNNEEIPCLPPFLPGQGLSEDEIVDIVLYGVPKSWINKMDEHDFDPLAHSLEELISFCERLESAEQLERGAAENKQPSNGKKSSSKKFKSSRNNSESGSGSGKWCHYHETDTHNTADCETLKRLKSREKGGSSSSGPSKNKTWKRKADDAKSYSKKELSAIGKKAAKSAIKKAKAECNAVAKRKTEEDEMSVSSDSSESINSANVVEKLDKVDKELANFDFSEDGEISC